MPEVCDGKDNNCDGLVDEGLVNPCGGCSSLEGKPGDACPSCGVLYCEGSDDLACAPAGSTVGKACVADSGCPGTFVCSAATVQCVAEREPDVCGVCTIVPRKGVLGQACSDGGGCTGSLVCAPDGSGLSCIGGSINACGVCGSPVQDLGGTCIAPTGCQGRRVCSTDGQKSECQPLMPANQCGLCGGVDVPGIGEPCATPGGKVGRAVCNKARDGLDCAHALVTLSFDDANDDNVLAGKMMAERGLRGIFYINSPRINVRRYLSLQEVTSLVALGNEIGGHTLHHLRLPTLSADAQRMEICGDRAALLADGFPVRSLAYPFGDADSTTLAIARECNFDSARLIASIPAGLAESLSPENVMRLNAPPSIASSNVLADLQGRVLGAEQNGGWVFVNMHHVCDGCAANGVRPDLLAAFLDWVVVREADGTFVRTPRDVLAGRPLPAVSVPDIPGGLLANGSFEDDADHDSIPDCWQRVGQGRATSWTEGVPRTGRRAASATVSAPGDRATIESAQNATCGVGLQSLRGSDRQCEVSAWYISPTADVTLVLFLRDAEGNWLEWQESPPFPKGSEYQLAAWRVKSPEGAALGVGIRISTPGTLTVDDFVVRDLSLESGDE